MIGEILAYLKNYFVVETYHGTFKIKNGQVPEDVPFHDGQYYRVIGSVFNDGVWQFGTDTLTDEEFTGTVQLLAVPPDLLKICEEINKYNKETGEASPYISESFGGYSYTKAIENGRPISWRSAFAGRLARWRKL